MAKREEPEVDIVAGDGVARSTTEIRLDDDRWVTPHVIGPPSTGIGERPYVEPYRESQVSTHRFPRIFGREED